MALQETTGTSSVASYTSLNKAADLTSLFTSRASGDVSVGGGWFGIGAGDTIAIDKQAADTFGKALDGVIDKGRQDLAEFDKANDLIETAFQGKIKESAKAHVTAGKDLLQAYLDYLATEKTVLKQAAASYETNDAEASNSVTTASGELTDTAGNIRSQLN